MNRFISSKILLLIALAALTAGCGGGGGGGSSTPANPIEGSSDWDSMVWDQDVWG